MPKVIVNPPWLPKPSGYSHGIEAQGRMLFVAGQTALDTDGRIAHVGDLVGQFRQALANVGAVVGLAGRHAAGPGEGDVLRGRQARVPGARRGNRARLP